MLKLNEVIHGDCLSIIKTIPDNFIDLTITSPPYDKIRDYGNNWVLDINSIGKELFRITKEGGIAIMVIQDGTNKGAKTLSSFRAIIDWCDNGGWRLFETCIYQRSGTPGAWWNKRFRVDHEYIAIFVKGDRPQYFCKEHLMVDAIQAGKIKKTGGYRKTDGTTAENTLKEIAPKKCRGTIWNYSDFSKTRDKIKNQHPASFPDQLAYDLIRTFSTEDMIIFDPMMGSGTVAVESEKLNRKWIGSEINLDYINNIIIPRLNIIRRENKFFLDDYSVNKNT